MARSRWVSEDTVALILALLTPENALAVECSLRYGMRIGDVLALRRAALSNTSVTYREEKTGKRRRVQFSESFRVRLLQQAGVVWVFPHRVRPLHAHRTRQAVYKDMRRAAVALRLGKAVSPHSARKVYAVRTYHARGMQAVKRLLNHQSEAVTMLYALADEMESRK